ncbi:serine/threonine-protein kinase [Arthrobacter globiformis]|uniref:serine/threonine-protein kinase n=1 Tax=Arthrobacter globiformis TaxID=1665 RepID=UPI001CB94CE4|nr:serine/threonine-protein kinase [Arthrobacter globiformis]
MTEGQRPDVAGQLMCQRYRLQELVGRGAAAAVYRAVDEALGRDVALKLFSKEGGEPELLARQQAEIRILASMIHPSLVTLFDAGTDPAMERNYVIMEYVPGPDLRRHLRTDGLTPADIAAVGADLASALDYIHSRGVIHRDIKPGNVLLHTPDPSESGKQWRAKLTDFGIARVMEEEHLTRTGCTVGTAAYLSPEQALGEPLNGASDVYSLGLVLLECFTRRVEFPGNQIESGVARIHRSPVIPDNVDTEWKTLLTAMTARHPADRPSAAEAATALQHLVLVPDAAAPPAPQTSVSIAPVPQLGNRPYPPAPSRRPTVTPRMRRKHGSRVRTLIVASVAAVILAGTTSATFGRGGPDQSAAPAPQAALVQNNPLDFHLQQLQSALEPLPVLLPILDQVRQDISDEDLHSALAHLDRLEKDATDEAARDGLTFEQYRNITAAIRLVRNDLQTLIAASTKSPVEAISPVSKPAAAPEGIPAVNRELAPVAVVNPAPAQAVSNDPVQQENQVMIDNQAKPTPGPAGIDEPVAVDKSAAVDRPIPGASRVGKPKRDKPHNHSGTKGHR